MLLPGQNTRGSAQRVCLGDIAARARELRDRVGDHAPGAPEQRGRDAGQSAAEPGVARRRRPEQYARREQER
eukprot:3157046-Rhodomonas_salina.1